MFLLWLRQLPQCGDGTPASVPPPTDGRSSPTNTPVFPPSSFLLLSFAWFYIFFFCWSGTPVHSKLVFYMHFCVYRCVPNVSWREMYSTSTYSSAIFVSSNLNFLICGGFLFKIQVPVKEHLASCPSLASSWGGLDLFSHCIYIQRKIRVLWQKGNWRWDSNKLQAKQIMKIHWHSINCGDACLTDSFASLLLLKWYNFCGQPIYNIKNGWC